MEVKLKISNAEYAGHTIKSSGVVNLNFEFPYEELVNIVPLIQVLNNTIEIYAKTDDEPKPFGIGNYMLNNLKINHDGVSKVRFNSIIDTVDNLDKLYGGNLQLLIKAKVVVEEA